MRNGLNLIFSSRKYLWGSLILLFIAVICAAFSMTGNNDFDVSRREVLLRRIGDELLLQSGDSTSRVLPVKNVAANEYQIKFEKEFSFKPEHLVNTTRQLLAKDPLTSDYVVNVLNNRNDDITYGFAISNNKKDDIIACKGRTQPTANYSIKIKFKPTETNRARKNYLLGSLPFLAFIGFIFLRSGKPKKTQTDSQFNSSFAFGSVLFDPKERQLIINKDIIELTGTETRLLLIFASSPNQIIERSRLQKEIWEDEGVIVGRSLDMFISKLRKKLEPDPDSNIVVIRGKGYRLEVSA